MVPMLISEKSGLNKMWSEFSRSFASPRCRAREPEIFAEKLVISLSDGLSRGMRATLLDEPNVPNSHFLTWSVLPILVHDRS